MTRIKRSENRGGDRPTATQRALNLRLLLGTVLALSLLAPTAYAWHRFQAQRIAQAFLERAAELEGEEEFAKAADYLYRYLQLQPADAEARARLAQVFDKSVDGGRGQGRAVDLYYRALGVAAPEQQPALRRRLAERLLNLGRTAEAEAEAGKLLEADAQDAGAQRLLALARYRQARAGGPAAARSPGETGQATGTTTVGETLAQAVQVNPQDVQLAMIYAHIQRNEVALLSESQQTATDPQTNTKTRLSAVELAKRADASVDALVAANPQQASASFARYNYRMQYHLPDADRDLRRALELAPDDVAIRLAAAQQARLDAGQLPREASAEEQRRAFYGQALEHYRHILKKDPTVEAAHLGSGEVYLALGEVEHAVKAWREGLSAAVGGHRSLHTSLAQVLIETGRLDEAQQTLQQLDAELSKLGPQVTPANREAMRRANELLRATWLARKGQAAEAIPQLSRLLARQDASSSDVVRLRGLVLLGQEYATVSQWDQAALAFEKAATLQPSAATHPLAAARAWAAAGQPERAILDAERALTLAPAPETRLLLAQCRLQQQLQLPPEQRKWQDFDQVLAELKVPHDQSPLNQPWRVTLLEAEALRARGAKPAEAWSLLRSAEETEPETLEWLGALVPAYEGWGCSEDADRALARLDEIGGNSVGSCRLHAALLIQRRQFEQAREVLRAGLAALPASEHGALRRTLAQVSLQQGQLEAAYGELVQLHEAQPQDVGVVRQLAELVFDTDHPADAERWETLLAELEGSAGSAWRYCRARRLLAQAQTPHDKAFLEATQIQTQLQSQRPSWPATHLLAGLIEERRDRWPEATAAYEQAIRLGDQRTSVFQRVIDLLYRQQRFAEAEQYLARLEEAVPRSQALSNLAVSVALGNNELELAATVAARGVKQRPQDPLAWISQGQVLAVRKQLEDAEAAFLKATQLAPDDPSVWNALFSYYARQDKPEQAREALQKLAANAKLSPDTRAFALGQGYELLRDAKQAETNYREAARLAPTSVPVQLRLASFYLQRDPRTAESLLYHVLKLAPDNDVARRTLANLLAERGGEDAWEQAQKLLERPGAEGQVAALDQRLQALLSARRPGAEHLKKAKEILERLVADPQRVTDGDRVLLAQVYARESETLGLTPVERQSRLRSASQQYLTVVARPKAQATHLGLYVDFLLRCNRAEEAAPWVQRLDEVASQDLPSVALKARWLQKLGRTAEIEPLVEGRAGQWLKERTTTEQAAELARRVGSLYTTVNLYPAAERWYRRLAKAEPGAYGPLAANLARQGRRDEAFRLCLEAASTDTSVQPAMTVAMLLASQEAKPAEFALSEPIFSAALAAHRGHADLLSALATVRLIQQQTEAAIQLYQEVLRLRPKDVLVLNNLACLLSEKPERQEESLQLVSRALEISGPQATLYDTKGSILVYAGHPREAIELLEAAVAVPDPDPRSHLHLAAAYYRTQAQDKARSEFQKARDRQLARQVLTAADTRLLAELQQQFGK